VLERTKTHNFFRGFFQFFTTAEKIEMLFWDRKGRRQLPSLTKSKMELLKSTFKTIYPQYLTEFKTDMGRINKENAEEKLKMGDKLKYATTTSKVKGAFKIVNTKVKAGLPIAIDEIKLIKIVPLMAQRLCHDNCKFITQKLNKPDEELYSHFAGYNITSCSCGRFVWLECHSVLKCNRTGEYLDLTSDYLGETQKYFVPIVKITQKNKIILNNLQKEMGGFCSFDTQEKHECKKDGITYCGYVDFGYNGDWESFCEDLKDEIENEFDEEDFANFIQELRGKGIKVAVI
jgi:hypothetical protein